MEFKAEVDLEYMDFVRFNKVYRKNSGKKAIKIINIILYAAASLLALEIIVVAAMGLFDRTMIIAAAFVLVAILSIIFRDRINGKVSQKLFLKDIGTVHVALGEEYAEFSNKKEAVIRYYSSFQKILKDSTALYLFVDDRHAEIIPFRCIVDASVEDVCAFLFKKTGMYVTNVNN